jgi:ABC-type polysaccharide/polyol phosphate export permease
MRKSNYLFLLSNLVMKDFKIRYRNMSLGVFWSLVNPLFMMLVLTFVFTKIFVMASSGNYAVFVLCGLVPLNFFTVAWAGGTTSVLDNGNLLRRVRFPREIVPIASVCSNCLHFGIQLALLIVFVLGAGYGFNRHWAWLPFIFGLEIVFVCGLALITSALDVYYRDLRYVVESANLVMFWLVPVIYSFTIIPQEYRLVYQFNPISAVVLACRDILLDGKPPATALLVKLFAVSFFMLGAGTLVFGKLKRRFADYV